MERIIKLYLLAIISLMSQSTYSQVLIGDANNDGDVSISDISTIVHHILGNSPQPFNSSAADYNSDGFITISDIFEIVNLNISYSS